MPIILCPRCRKRITVMDHIGDYICDCSQSSSSDVLKQEDVLVIGAWDDYSGSGGRTNLNQGIENKSQGTNAAIEGIKTHDLTSQGNIKTLYRQRPHLEYIELENGKNK